MRSFAVAALVAGASASAYYAPKNETIAYTTVTVDTYETYCPAPTTFTYSSKVYTVTEATTLTIDCPCTVKKPVITTTYLSYTPPPAVLIDVTYSSKGAIYTTPPAVYVTPAAPVAPIAAPSNATTVAPVAPVAPTFTGAANKAFAATGAGLAGLAGVLAYVL
ncbi:MAG: hypothetical protein M1825_003797 [Sarcosagium campestre]|nr:MAG: hypothetical protein M1825_003797 [Sarcosagium campestre]